MTKICRQCKIEKPLTEYYKDAKMPGGLRHNCKDCKNAKTIVWRGANRARYNEIARQHNRKHYPEDRLRRYGLTLVTHGEMLQVQSKLCALCGQPPGGSRPLVVDHHHADNYVRELLCYKCNRDMAAIDDEARLGKLIAYRDKHALKNKKAA